MLCRQFAMPASSSPCIRLLASIVEHARLGERRDRDDAGATVIQIEHRREAQIDTAGPQFCAKHVAAAEAASVAVSASRIHRSPKARMGANA